MRSTFTKPGTSPGTQAPPPDAPPSPCLLSTDAPQLPSQDPCPPSPGPTGGAGRRGLNQTSTQGSCCPARAQRQAPHPERKAVMAPPSTFRLPATGLPGEKALVLDRCPPIAPPSCSRAWGRSAASAGPGPPESHSLPVPGAQPSESRARGWTRAAHLLWVGRAVSPAPLGKNHLSPQQHDVQKPAESVSGLVSGWLCWEQRAEGRAPREPQEAAQPGLGAPAGEPPVSCS